MSATRFKLTTALAAGVMLAIGSATMVAMAQMGPVKKPEAITGKDSKPKRAATKLESGRIVLFPELAKKPVEKSTEEWQQLINDLQLPGDVPLEDGIRRIQWEQYRAIVDTVNLDFQIVLNGTWDVTFLNQYLHTLDQLSKVLKTISPPKNDMIRILKARMTFAYHLEEMVFQRAIAAQTLRTEKLFETRTVRHGCELDLAEAEDTAAKVP